MTIARRVAHTRERPATPSLSPKVPSRKETPLETFVHHHGTIGPTRGPRNALDAGRASDRSTAAFAAGRTETRRGATAQGYFGLAAGGAS